MTVSSNQQTSIIYSSHSLKRAQRALLCCVFNLSLFLAMINNSIFLLNMVGEKGKNNGYTNSIISERKGEQDLIWLIKVGLLRREVDGQGITDSFRLTPLGKQLVLQWQKQGLNFPQPSLWDRIINFFNRIFSLFSF
jgi:hypothetical protein